MAEDEKEIYEMICKDKFDELKEMHAETQRILRGRDSEPGLVDDVRGLKKAYKRMMAGGLFILAAIVVQSIRFIGEWISGILK